MTRYDYLLERREYLETGAKKARMSETRMKVAIAVTNINRMLPDYEADSDKKLPEGVEQDYQHWLARRREETKAR